jgi:hypothetical protein
MIVLHKDGSLVELNNVERVRPMGRNSVTGMLNIEVRFTSGITDIYSDAWHSKMKDNCSLYDLLLSEKFCVSWRDVVKF